jgi:hypothetical protein
LEDVGGNANNLIKAIILEVYSSISFHNFHDYNCIAIQSYAPASSLTFCSMGVIAVNTTINARARDESIPMTAQIHEYANSDVTAIPRFSRIAARN